MTCFTFVLLFFCCLGGGRGIIIAQMYKQSCCLHDPYHICKTSGGVEGHSPVESAHARDSVMYPGPGDIQVLDCGVRLHVTVHVQLEGGLTRDQTVVGLKGAHRIRIYDSATLKLFQ